MGTRAIYGFLKDDKYKITYSNFDGGYKNIGQNIVNFINTTSLEMMKDIFNRIVLVEALDIPNNKQILECKKYANLDISMKTLKDFCCLLGNTIGNLQYYRDENLKYMINYEDQLYSTAYGYIINLDTNMFEVYYYEDLLLKFNLSNIPNNWAEECDAVYEERYEKYEE